MSIVIPVPPAPAGSDAEPRGDAPVDLESASSSDAAVPSRDAPPKGVAAAADAPPAWTAPPDPVGPLTGLYLSMCGLILLVVSLIVAAGITGAVWVLVLAVVALIAALWLIIVVLMRFIT